MLECAEEVRQLLFNDDLLVGFDFFLDGRTRPKVYTDIRAGDLDRPEVLESIKRCFSATVVARVMRCKWVHVAFHYSKYRLLHFHHTRDADEVILGLGNELLSSLHEKFRGPFYRDIVVSLRDIDIDMGGIPHVATLYYEMPRPGDADA